MPSPELLDVGKCHQRVVRETYDDEPAPPVPHLSVRRARVRPVSFQTAKQIILRYEWLGTMATTSRHYGIFFGPFCAGATCFGQNVIAGVNFHQQFGLDDPESIWVLARGACVHWAPENTNSKLIAWSLRLLRDDEPTAKIVVAFSDVEAGEVGTVYQATNWTFLGIGEHGTPEIISPKGRVLNHRMITTWARRAGVTYGEQLEALREQGWRERRRNPKMKYVYVLDESDEDLVAHVEDKARPYPKRAG